MSINWENIRESTLARAEAFMNAEESERVWYIGGEILDSAVVCGAWDDNVKMVCEWVKANGLGAQPSLAEHLLERNS